MAIVLPQGRLNNISDAPIRNYLAEHARILAVVGLQGNTFKPHTNTKTSILFLQKWNDDPKAGPLCPKLKDYPIFFAVSQRCGKDNSGEYVYLHDDKGRRLNDLHGHPIVDHDLFNLRRFVTGQYLQRLSAARTAADKEKVESDYRKLLPYVPDQPGIADAFREWGRTQGFPFCVDEKQGD